MTSEEIKCTADKQLSEKAIRLIQAHDRAVSQWKSDAREVDAG